jgi:hypothetical protein
MSSVRPARATNCTPAPAVRIEPTAEGSHAGPEDEGWPRWGVRPFGPDQELDRRDRTAREPPDVRTLQP